MALVFQGKIPTSTTEYFNLPIGPKGFLFIDVQWKDATSSATITLETTGTPDPANGPFAPGGATSSFRPAGETWDWKTESGVTITGPAASAAGSTKVHVSNFCNSRARLKIVTAAVCDFIIYSETR